MESKAALRQQARRIRKALPPGGLDDLMVRRMAALPRMAEATHVLLYAPLTDEINLLGLMERFPEKAFYLPRITPDDRLDFHRYGTGDPLETHAYGMPEPLAEAPGLDAALPGILVVVPALMADERGFRLGYGKSFYDRFLQSLRRKNPRAVAIAALPDVLVRDRLPTDPWDEPVDVILTEKRILEIQG